MNAPLYVFVIVGCNGKVRGYAYESRVRAEAVLPSANEDYPETTPHRVEVYVLPTGGGK